MSADLKKLDHYSTAELESAARAWPAVARYFNLLALEGKTEIEKLKLRRHTAWLRCALALFHQSATDEAVCKWWSDQTDLILNHAAQIVGLDTADLAVFALGKLGAQELNLSSDIDLIFIRSGHRASEATHTKAVKQFIQILSENDAMGFCYRVDATIRPGGGAGPLVSTIDGFENHYGYYGETWERLAMIRLRKVLGSDAVADAVLDFSSRYTFRKRIDLGLLEELRMLMSRIRAEHSERQARLGSNEQRLHLKLDPGGIRELELLVHALLVIHGGRDPSLRTHRTAEAIDRLVSLATGSLNPADGEQLKSAYWNLRSIENRLQCKNDEQTYWIDCSNEPELCQSTRETMQTVRSICERILPIQPVASKVAPRELEAIDVAPEIAESILTEIESIELFAQNRERAQSERNAFLRAYIENLKGARQMQVELALKMLMDFLKSARAKSSLFSVLSQNPELTRKLSLVFSNSSYGSSLLIRRPELLDGILFRRAPPPATDIESRLLQLQELRQVHEVIATFHFLDRSGSIGPTQSASSLADAIASEVMAWACKQTQSEPIQVVALGKWGGRELGVRSDLDFVLVCRDTPTENQHRACRRFLNWIQTIYSIDLRLRPSGQAGPLLLSEEALITYLRSSAMAWERQSWLRMRTVPAHHATHPEEDTQVRFNRNVDRQPDRFAPDQLRSQVIETVLIRGLSDTDKSETMAIHQQLFVEPQPLLSASGSNIQLNELDLKLTRGGLAEIEFAAQLLHMRAGLRSPLLTSSHSSHPTAWFLSSLSRDSDDPRSLSGQNIQQLSQTYEWLRTVEQLHRLTSEMSDSKLTRKGSGYEHLCLLAARQDLLGSFGASDDQPERDLLEVVKSKMDSSSLTLKKVWNTL